MGSPHRGAFTNTGCIRSPRDARRHSISARRALHIQRLVRRVWSTTWKGTPVIHPAKCLNARKGWRLWISNVHLLRSSHRILSPDDFFPTRGSHSLVTRQGTLSVSTPFPERRTVQLKRLSIRRPSVVRIPSERKCCMLLS